MTSNIEFRHLMISDPKIEPKTLLDKQKKNLGTSIDT